MTPITPEELREARNDLPATNDDFLTRPEVAELLQDGE